jgi:hypothetical protein
MENEVGLSSLRKIVFDEQGERQRVQETPSGTDPFAAVVFARGLEGLQRVAPSDLDQRFSNLLEDLAYASQGHWAHGQLVEAFAFIRFSPEVKKGAEHFSDFVWRQITDAAGSADRRHVRASAAGLALRFLARSNRLPIVTALRKKWEREMEPQSKLALAATIYEAAKDRQIPQAGLDHFPE